jgi:hypothetical protein
MEDSQAPWLWQLQGYVKTVTTIPTYMPRTFDQSIKLYMNDLATPTTKRLYIYSFEAGIWNYIALT